LNNFIFPRYYVPFVLIGQSERLMERPGVVSYSKFNRFKNSVCTYVVLVLRSVVKLFAKYHIFIEVKISRHNVPIVKIGIFIEKKLR